MRRYLEKYLRGEKNNSVENKEEKRKKREKKKKKRKKRRKKKKRKLKEKSKGDFGRKNRTFSWFFTREREREKKRGSASLYDLRRSSGWISLGQELKVIYLARAMRGHSNQEFRRCSRFRIFGKLKVLGLGSVNETS